MNKYIIFALTVTVFLSTPQSEEPAPLAFDDISRAGGVALQDLQAVDGQIERGGVGTIRIGDSRLTMGVTDSDLLNNYQQLEARFNNLQKWFQDLDQNAGKVSGIGAYLWEKINDSLSGINVAEQGNEALRRNMQAYMRVIVMAESLKERHEADMNLMPANTPEHEFYFQIVQRPANRILALSEADDVNADPPKPLRLRVATQSTALRVRGLMNRDEVVGRLSKGATVAAHAAILRGLLPVGYRIVLPATHGIRNTPVGGFVPAAYIDYMDGIEVNVLTGQGQYARLKGKPYLFEKVWQSVKTAAAERASRFSAQVDTASARAQTLSSQVSGFMQGFSDRVNAWKVESRLDVLSTPANGVELELAPELKALAERPEYSAFFDARKGIDLDKLQEAIDKETTDQGKIAVQERAANLLTRLEELTRSGGVKDYLADAASFRQIESRLGAVNSRLAVLAQDGFSLQNVDASKQPELARVASLLNDESLKPYFVDGRLNLAALALRFGQAGAERRPELERLGRAVDTLRQINISTLTQERFRADPVAERPAISPVLEQGVTNAEVTTDETVAAPASASTTASDLSSYFASTNAFLRQGLSFVANSGDRVEQIEMNLAGPNVTPNSHHLIVSYRLQSALLDKLKAAGYDVESDNRDAMKPKAKALADALLDAQVVAVPESGNYQTIIRRDLSQMGEAMTLMAENLKHTYEDRMKQTGLGRSSGQFFNGVFMGQNTGGMQFATLFSLFLLDATGNSADLDSAEVQAVWPTAMASWNQLISHIRREPYFSEASKLSDVLLVKAGQRLQEALTAE